LSKSNCKTFHFRILLIGINLLMFFLIVYFGLFFRGFSLSNNVSWMKDQEGLRFGYYGMAYTNTLFPAGENNYKQGGLSIELAIRADNFRSNRFKILLSIHGGVDSEQLVLGQWRSALIVMNGDDYDGSLRTPRITVLDAFQENQNTFINIISGKDGTRVYVNGELRQSSARLNLEIPNKISDAVMVLGNSPYGRHSWSGNIYGLAIYERLLSEEKTSYHYNQWLKSHVFSFPRDIQPKVFYAFDDNDGRRAFDSGPNEHHLKIPSRMKILKKEILVAPWNEERLDWPLVQDMVINLVGFIVPGFFFFALLVNFNGWLKTHAFLVTVGTCFMVSLNIEMIQVWIPSRSSQSLDLIMNTMGGMIGAMLYTGMMKIVTKIGFS